MKTNYRINGNELIVNIDFLYNIKDYYNEVSDTRKYINKLLVNNNIKFYGNKIIIYQNGILIGIFYLTNYYLRKLNYIIKDKYLSNNNSYFFENSYVEIYPKNKLKKFNVAKTPKKN
ncbi:MAG: hypothetical protein IKN63_03970 [Bacilli bacterium]|nr:hypothetical protein [Bacilli bacterium]